MIRNLSNVIKNLNHYITGFTSYDDLQTFINYTLKSAKAIYCWAGEKFFYIYFIKCFILLFRSFLPSNSNV